MYTKDVVNGIARQMGIEPKELISETEVEVLKFAKILFDIYVCAENLMIKLDADHDNYAFNVKLDDVCAEEMIKLRNAIDKVQYR